MATTEVQVSHRAIQKLILCANNSRLELSQQHHSPRWLCEQFSNSHCSQQGLLNHPQHPSRCVCLCQVPGCCNVPSWYRQIQKCHGVERGPCEWDWEDNSTSARGMSLGSTTEAMSVVTGVYCRGNVCCHWGLPQRQRLWAYCCAFMPTGMGMHSSFIQDHNARTPVVRDHLQFGRIRTPSFTVPRPVSS